MKLNKSSTVVIGAILAVFCLGAFLLWPRDDANENAPRAVTEANEPEPKEIVEPEIDPEDTDGDGLKDSYELIFYHHISSTGDEDKDGLPDQMEMSRFKGLDGTSDEDKDGLPDAWEMTYFKSLDQGPEDNPDGDAYKNIHELVRMQSPTSVNKTRAEMRAMGHNLPGAAGSSYYGPDHKKYSKGLWEQAVKAGKFDMTWEELREIQ